MKRYLPIWLLIFHVTAHAQLTYETLTVNYDSAWQYKNLKIIPIRPKGNGPEAAALQNGFSNIISLSQAISKGLATITERGTASTENVHWLRINNNSNKSILVSSGEIIAGGRQDRMVMRDSILVPNQHDQYIPVMCVEEDRWSDKEKKFAYSNYANQRLRKVLDQNKNQVLIWNEIGHQMDDFHSSAKTKSLAFLSRRSDKNYQPAGDDYFKYFIDKFKKSDSSIVGFVCVSGNKVIGSDIFAGRNLFYDQLEPLLRGYIDDALFYGRPPSLPDKELVEYMDKLLMDERTQKEFVSKNGKIFRSGGKVIHINTY